MDSILILPPKNQIPEPALAALLEFIQAHAYSQEYGAATAEIKVLNEDRPTRLCSRKGNTAAVQAAMALAETHAFPLAVTIDGDTCGWNDACYVTWYDPGSKAQKEGSCRTSDPTPNFPTDKCLQIATDLPAAKAFLQECMVLKTLGLITNIPEHRNSICGDVLEVDAVATEEGPGTRRVEVDVAKTGVRIRLTSGTEKDPSEGPDIYIEAQVGKWVVYAHATEFEEPTACIEIPDQGEPTNKRLS